MTFEVCGWFRSVRAWRWYSCQFKDLPGVYGNRSTVKNAKRPGRSLSQPLVVGPLVASLRSIVTLSVTCIYQTRQINAGMTTMMSAEFKTAAV